MWSEIEAGINQIYAKNISKANYSYLYTLVYNFCTDFSVGGFKSNSIHLHQKISSFLETYIKNIQEKHKDLYDEPLLMQYMQLWEDYSFSSKVLCNACEPLHRHWIRREHEIQRLKILEIYQLALNSWEKYFLKPMMQRMSTAILKLIGKERNGETINTGLIKFALKSYIDIGINCADYYSDNSLYLYKTAFETAFLSETEVFYTNCYSISLKRIQNWYKEEERRAQLYLHESTLGAVTKVLEKHIEKHIAIIEQEFKNALCGKKIEDLKGIFQLFSRFPGVFDQMNIQFEDFVALQALKAMEKSNEGATDDKNILSDPDWGTFWRLLFPKLKLKNIDDYLEKYKGSEEEKQDLKQNYVKYEGDFNLISECLIGYEFEDEPRYRDTINTMIKNKEAPEFPKFIRERKARQAARKKRLKAAKDPLLEAIAQRSQTHLRR